MRRSDKAFKIFTECFGCLGLNEKRFAELSGIDSPEITLTETDGGLALIRDNRIELLMVSPENRGKGIGGRLLSECENIIRRNGFDKALLGGELLCGAPEESCGFFEKRGYGFGNMYAEMYIELSGYADPLPENNAEFGFYGGGIEKLKANVAKVDDDWVQFFGEDNEYFCGYADGEPISFCIFEDDVSCLASRGAERCGSVGCVGTVPEFRKRGIGLKMVSLALAELKRRGCDRCFIHKTHLWDWYGKLGAKVILKYREGEKRI